jgi:hypothetical protein
MDGVSSRILDSQHYVSVPDPEPGERPDRLVFQVDLAAGETRQYYLFPGWALPVTPQPVLKTFARQPAASRAQPLEVTVSGR